MEKLMEISHVGYSYHTMQGETPALSNINFTVHKGDFLAVVGPSGCGNAMVALRKLEYFHTTVPLYFIDFRRLFIPRICICINHINYKRKRIFIHLITLHILAFFFFMLRTFALGSYFPQRWQYLLWQAFLPFLHSPNAT